MPGKHAPASPASFYLSLARFTAAALGIVALVSGMAVALVKSGSPPPAGPPVAASRTGTASPSESVGPSPEPEPRPHRQVTVAVLNGARVDGLASQTALLLQGEGYRNVAVGNATTTERTTIFFRNRATRVDAQELLETFPAFIRIERSPVPQTTDLRVVLGTDYEEPG